MKVIVIGAGPAGCVAGGLLAREGVDVTIVEQHRFPREKVCGECVSSLGVEVLERIGLRARIETCNPIRLTRAMLWASSEAKLEVTLPKPMMGISRSRLDVELLEWAKAGGANICQPARFEGAQGNDPVRVSIRDLATNQVQTQKCDWLLMADGKRVGAKLTGELGIKCHFEKVAGPRDAIELFGVVGSYGGLAAIEGGRWNAAFTVPAWRVKQWGGNLDLLFKAMVSENRELARRLAGSKRVTSWITTALPRYAVTQQKAGRVIPIGNAAAAIEPVGGEGIGLALSSAEMVANSLLDINRKSGSSALAQLPLRYSQLWSFRGLGCRLLGRLMSDPGIATAGISVGDHLVAAAVMAGIGKI